MTEPTTQELLTEVAQLRRLRNQLRNERDQALDALETMCEQYLEPQGDNHLGHLFMRAGEEATAVLSGLRPERWIDSRAGLVRRVESQS